MGCRQVDNKRGLTWKIYYGDGQTYSSLDGAIEDTPTTDVQVIILIDRDHGWTTQTGTDYYVWDNRGNGPRWWGVDYPGYIDYLIEPGWKKVLLGRTIPSDIFNSIYKRASEDPDFPKKTSFSNKERKA